MAVVPYPVIRYPGGPPSMIDLWDYEPGYPAPEIIHDDHGRDFKLDMTQEAYVPYVVPPRPPRPAPPQKPMGFWEIMGTGFFVLFAIGAVGCVLAVAWPLLIPLAIVAGIVKLCQGIGGSGRSNEQWCGD